MSIHIFKDRADYSIDGEPYAYTFIPEDGDYQIPKKGYFGFGLYDKNECKLIENVAIS